jgi:deoxyuridine 5'-triphosphate nucleotidohydrolase
MSNLNLFFKFKLILRTPLQMVKHTHDIMNTFNPYFLGTLINFCKEGYTEGYVHNKYCSLQQLYSVHDYVKQFKPLSKVEYKTHTGFSFSLLFEYNIWKTFSEQDKLEFFQGVIDMNAEIIVHSQQLEMNFYSQQLDFLKDLYEELYKTWKIPGVISENASFLHKLTYVSTNVIDLMGMFPKSYKHSELNIYIQGIAKLSKCGVIRRDPLAILPSKSRLSDVGYDVHILRKHKQLNTNTALYDTGIALEIPLRYYVEIVPRSSLSKTGYMLSNSMGIIDPSYRGNLYIALTKVSPDAISLEEQLPFRCCQIIFRKQEFVELEEIQEEDSSNTTRGSGGFGSTG